MANSINRVFVKLLLWAVLEILLTLLNLDDMADYSEFLQKKIAFSWVTNVEWVARVAS